MTEKTARKSWDRRRLGYQSLDGYTEKPYSEVMGLGHNFDWDDDKATSNVAKHGISFEYAARIFLDADRVDFDVSRREDGEQRRKSVGLIENRLITVVYTQRSDTIRIISARRCNGKEQRQYGTFQA